jgi:transposase InsO family protein
MQGNQALLEWNIYYNSTRRHHSLGLLSPYQFAISKGMSQMMLTFTES